MMRKVVIKKSSTSVSVPKAASSQTLSECMIRCIATWCQDSVEYKYRLDGVVQMLISSCRAVSTVNDSRYRESMGDVTRSLLFQVWTTRFNFIMYG